MAMVARTPAHCPWRWLLLWQSSHGTEGTDDQHFRVALSQDAVQWSAPLVLSLSQQGPVWGPVLHVHDDVMWLFYSQSVACKRIRECAPVVLSLSGARYISRLCAVPYTCDPSQRVSLARVTLRARWVTLRDGWVTLRARWVTCALSEVADAGKPVRWCPGGDLKYVQSRDAVHWTSPVTIHTQAANGGVPKVVANQLVETPTGTWVLPFWSEPPRSEPSPACATDAPHTSGVLLSHDHGITWRPSAVIQVPPRPSVCASVSDAGPLQYLGASSQVAESGSEGTPYAD